MYCNKSDVHVTFCRYTESLDAILEEISIYEKHQALLTELDESKALNFLLYGPPGTGKSSLIATLASECSCALYVVNAQAIKPHQLSDLLYPESQSSSRLKLLLNSCTSCFVVSHRCRAAYIKNQCSFLHNCFCTSTDL